MPTKLAPGALKTRSAHVGLRTVSLAVLSIFVNRVQCRFKEQCRKPFTPIRHLIFFKKLLSFNTEQGSKSPAAENAIVVYRTIYLKRT
jgi:hypothetical protein